MSEEYSIGYSEGYQAGWNAAMDATPPTQPAPVQEPVAWVNRMTIDSTNELSPPAAKRQWVGISMDDIVAAVIQHGDSIRFEHDFARAIEAKLKEKNT